MHLSNGIFIESSFNERAFEGSGSDGGFAEILRLSSYTSDKPFSNIRRFSPLRMTKCAAPSPLNLLNL